MRRFNVSALAALATVLFCACGPDSGSPFVPSSTPSSGGEQAKAEDCSGSDCSDGDAPIRMGAMPVRDGNGVIETYRTTEVSGEHIGHTIPTDSGGDTASITSGALHVGDGAGALNVIVDSSALPTGAATETTLSAVNTKTPALGQGLMAASSPVVIASNQSAVPVGDGSGALTVDGAVTVGDGSGPLTIDGTVATSNGATEATLADIEGDVDTLLTRTPAVGQAAMVASSPVVIASNQSTLPVGDGSGPLTIDGTVTIATSGLPTGAATETTLADIEGDVDTLIARTPALGQGLMAASTPVVIASNQSAVTVGDGSGALTVDGTVTVGSSSLPTGAASETTLSAINTKTPALGQAAMVASVPVALASNQSAIPVTVNSSGLPTGAATEVTLTALNTKTPALGQAAMAASVPVTLANNQSTITVGDGSGAMNTIVDSSALPTGAATEATLAAINTKTLAAGQALMAASSPVVIASNQSSIPVGDGTGALTVDGTVAITTGSSGLGKGEDTLHVDGDVSVAALAIRRPSAQASTITDGDYSALAVDPDGRLYATTIVTGTVAVAVGSIAAGANNIGDVDAVSVIPGTGATNLGKAEDQASASGDVGVLALGVRRDTAASSTITDGDVATFNLDSAGRLYVSDTKNTEDVAHGSGDTGTMSLARVDNSAGSTSTAGDYATLNVTTTGDLRVSPLGLVAEDSAHANAQNLFPAAVLRQDTPASTSGNNEHTMLSVDATGHLWVRMAADQEAGFFENTTLNQVASNADSNGSVIDVRGYTEVLVEVSFSSTGADATGFTQIWGGNTTSPITEGVELGDTIAVISDNAGASCSYGESTVGVDTSYDNVAGVNGVCVFRLTNPPPYIIVAWDRVSGGSAAGSTGLTVRVYGTAK